MEIEQVIEFWFGSDINDPELAKKQSPLWWKKSPQTDSQIREKFAAGLQGLVDGDYNHWFDSPGVDWRRLLLPTSFPAICIATHPGHFPRITGIELVPGGDCQRA